MPRNLSHLSIKVKWLTAIFGLLTIVPSMLAYLPSSHASALTGSDFNPSRIIDDAIFTNSNALSVQDIQNFLNSKMPSCDTYGNVSKSYYYNSSTGRVNNSADSWVTTTRAVYGQRYATWNNTNDSNAPYICLRDYVENPTTGQNNLQNPSASISGGQTAAQIIYNASQAYGINPEVLITLLQKEQGLVTDDWPWLDEYRYATGYNCSDTSGCSGYAGFFQQVDAAAKQFRNYLTNPYNFNYVAGSGNKIYYAPTSVCSNYSYVTIQNQATAALYDYTPYQPDTNVLNATNPTGSSSGPGGSINDACAAYGNRNFWWYFNTWFGSTTDPFDNPNIKLSGSLNINPTDLYAGQNYTATFTVTNSASYPITVGSLMVVVRGPQGQNHDVPLDSNVTIAANSTYTYNKTWFTPDVGWHQFSIVMYKDGFGYSYSDPAASSTSVIRNTWINVKPNPQLSTSLTLNPSTPIAGQNYTATFSITNHASYPINIGSPMVIVRGPQGQNRDVPLDSNITIPANSTYTYNKTWFTPDAGWHQFTVALYKNNSYDLSNPVAADGSIVRHFWVNVRSNPVLSTSLTLNPAQPHANQNYTATYSIQNDAEYPVFIGSPMVVVRGPQGQNRDVPLDSNITIPAHTTYTYNKTWFTPDTGQHQFSIVLYNNGNYNYSYPTLDGSIIRNLTVNVLP